MQKKIDLVNGPVLSSLTRLAVPIMATSLIQMAYNMTDMIWIGRIGSSAVASVGAAGMYMWLSNGLAALAKMGGQVNVGHALGASNSEEAAEYASNALQLTLILGIIYGLVCILGAKPLIHFFHLNQAQVIRDAIYYLEITCGLVLFSFLNQTYTGLFTAIGNSRPVFLATTTGLVVNIILDPVLIFGLGPFPSLGIEGAALATGLGQTFSAILYLIFYMVAPISVKFRRAYFKPDFALCKKMYSIGIPASLNMALPSLLISSLNVILAGFGQSYVFVLGVYYKLQTFLYLPANGVIQGMRPLIGYNYGAKEHSRVNKIYQTSLILVLAIMAVGTVLCLCIPGTLIHLFTATPATIKIGSSALHIICLGFLVSSVSVTSSGALEGLGMGLPSLNISLCRYTLIIIPLAFLLSLLQGASGVWHAFWITEAITAIISYWIYHRKVRAL